MASKKDLNALFKKEYAKFSNDIDADYPFPIDLSDYEDFARHFFELGLNASADVADNDESDDRCPCCGHALSSGQCSYCGYG